MVKQSHRKKKTPVLQGIRHVALALIMGNEPVSIQEICDMTGLSWQAVHKYVRLLLDLGVVKELPKRSGCRQLIFASKIDKPHTLEVIEWEEVKQK